MNVIWVQSEQLFFTFSWVCCFPRPNPQTNPFKRDDSSTFSKHVSSLHGHEGYRAKWVGAEKLSFQRAKSSFQLKMRKRSARFRSFSFSFRQRRHRKTPKNEGEITADGASPKKVFFVTTCFLTAVRAGEGLFGRVGFYR